MLSTQLHSVRNERGERKLQVQTNRQQAIWGRRRQWRRDGLRIDWVCVFQERSSALFHDVQTVRRTSRERIGKNSKTKAMTEGECSNRRCWGVPAGNDGRNKEWSFWLCLHSLVEILIQSHSRAERTMTRSLQQKASNTASLMEINVRNKESSLLCCIFILYLRFWFGCNARTQRMMRCSLTQTAENKTQAKSDTRRKKTPYIRMLAFKTAISSWRTTSWGSKPREKETEKTQRKAESKMK